MLVPVKPLGAGFVSTLDQAGFEIPLNAFTSVRNMRPRNGWLERFQGDIQLFSDTLVRPYGIYPFDSPFGRYIVYAGRNAFYADTASTRTDLTGGTAPTAATTSKWTGGNLGGVQLFNNPQDKPFFWGGDVADNVEPLTYWPSTDLCAALRVFGNYAISMNITRSGVNGPKRVQWSDAAIPGTLPSWTDALTNDAGEQDVDGDGPLIDGRALGDAFILYFARSMATMRLVGGNDVFRFDRLRDPSGMLAANCSADTPMGHVVLTQGDVVLNSGAGVRSIVEGRTRKWLFNTMDTTYAAQSFVVAHPAKSEVWICFPETGESTCTLALVWNWADDAFGVRELPRVTAAATGVIGYNGTVIDDVSEVIDTVTTIIDDYPGGETVGQNDTTLFMASYNTKIIAVDNGDDFHGTAFSATAERTGMHFDQPDIRKLMTRIWLQFDAVAGTVVTVYAGASESAKVAPTYGTGQTFTVGTSEWVDVMVSGRYLAYKVEGSASAAFRVKSEQFEIQPMGRF